MPKILRYIVGLAILLCFCLAIKTRLDMQAVPISLRTVLSDILKPQVVDRNGIPLTISYQNRWNSYDFVPLHEIPEFLQQTFILSEDKRFYNHHGSDWPARLHALWQNILAGEIVRGASTVSEQVVRMLHPRPRTIWARWMEGFEANQLEKLASKSDILEFYLNQVPYSANRRGVVQAARYYFNREIDTLSPKEMIALSVLVRAPSSLDLYRHTDIIEPALNRLALKLFENKILSEDQYNRISEMPFELTKPELPVQAPHFINYISQHVSSLNMPESNRIHTSLNSHIQKMAQDILDERISHLKKRKVLNGAILVVDHTTGEILAWVVAGSKTPDYPGSAIDAVTSLRQPGSALKPFLYALALENGWTAASMISDSPLTESVGAGLHAYHNYNHSYYGPVSLRNALGNSLNIPAIRTVQFVGEDNYLAKLRSLGFENLVHHPDFYGDGLALGNGEVTLFEMVQAYSVFAHHGILQPLRYLKTDSFSEISTRIFSDEIASLMGNILSDPEARNLEFGVGSLLNFPVQTAVKTGTSSDYRDAWAVGFNSNFTAGIWMGNLDGTPTDGITGSTGPALVLRSVFYELNKIKETKPLYLSPRLVQQEICSEPSDPADEKLICRTEWFISGTYPEAPIYLSEEDPIRLRQPTNGLQLAMDPRIPDDQEIFEFQLTGISDNDKVLWQIDHVTEDDFSGGTYYWTVKKGYHQVCASVYRNRTKIFETKTVSFIVK